MEGLVDGYMGRGGRAIINDKGKTGLFGRERKGACTPTLSDRGKWNSQGSRLFGILRYGAGTPYTLEAHYRAPTGEGFGDEPIHTRVLQIIILYDMQGGRHLGGSSRSSVA